MDIYGKKKVEDDKEVDLLLDEIPNVTSHSFNSNNHQYYSDLCHYVYGSDYGASGSSMQPHYRLSGNVNLNVNDEPLRHCNSMYPYASSPASGFSLPSDGSSSNSGGRRSDNGSPPMLEEFKPSHVSCMSSYNGKGQLFDPEMMGPNGSKEPLMDEMAFCKSVGRMSIRNGDDVSLNPDGARVYGQSSVGVQHTDFNKFFANARLREAYPRCEVQPSASRSPLRLNMEMNLGENNGNRMRAFLEPGLATHQQKGALMHLNNLNRLRTPQFQMPTQQADKGDMTGMFLRDTNTFRRPANADHLYYAGKNAIATNEEQLAMHPHNISHINHARQQFGPGRSMRYGLQQPNGRTRESPRTRISPRKVEMDRSVASQGEGLNLNGGFNSSMVRSSFHGAQSESRLKVNGRTINATRFEKPRSSWKYSPLSMPLKYNSLAEAQGNIYSIAKDQHGCRFLQHVFEEGSQQDVQMIFTEIIGHIVELMMNPFGNYLIQKLLDVCDEEQKMQVLMMATAQPGELVKISLNNHGTRVVQKLIETLQTKEHISLVIQALEHGFLALIKDLNGNHVVQRCLECFSSEDNKFIFVAAAEHCVDIATHQHGCCVLQRCISYSTKEHRENLVSEIASNGLLLAQDPYGNYVVQFILELKIPSATSILISQFEGNYVHLSMLKGGSHVVEKCLIVFEAENRSRIIHELLSTARFEQLIQDPHANYVVQMAIQVSEGSLYNMLAEEIESHRETSRNSPYCKKIFSQKLFKK